MMLPPHVIERLNEVVDPLKDRRIITTGVGQHQMWAAQHSGGNILVPFSRQ